MKESFHIKANFKRGAVVSWIFKLDFLSLIPPRNIGDEKGFQDLSCLIHTHVRKFAL